MPAEKLPSMAGRRVLLNLAAGRGSAHGLYGMSAHGGHSGTMVALRRRGLIDTSDQLTGAGNDMVARLTTTPEVRHGA